MVNFAMIMNRVLSVWALLLGCIVSLSAGETAGSLLGKMATRLEAHRSTVAQYAITADGHTQRGTLTISGNRFVLNSPDASAWFDGKTQWTYSPRIGEVNITEPSLQEQAQVNPFAIIKSFRRNYAPSFMGGKIKLTSKSKGNEIQAVLIGVNRKTLLPTDIMLTMKSGQKVKINIHSIKDGGSLNPGKFKLNPKTLPRGVEIVDLR